MGLDMHLYKDTYIGAHYKHREVHGKLEIMMGGRKVPVKLERVGSIREQVGYWRKANAIHAWFVDNVQRGEDDCEEYAVSRDQLETLRELCARALETADPTLLKPRDGFFFGSTEIDSDYWDDLRATIEIITDALEDSDGANFFYTSSW